MPWCGCLCGRRRGKSRAGRTQRTTIKQAEPRRPVRAFVSNARSTEKPRTMPGLNC
jgi:hypothetical protein